jgi:Protein of unknown function (DUF2891)
LLDDFPAWLDRFLPGIADGEPATLFTPVEVSDPSDEYIAHLHGLNLSRAWCFRRLAVALGDGDLRAHVMLDAAQRHAAASLEGIGSSHTGVQPQRLLTKHPARRQIACADCGA